MDGVEKTLPRLRAMHRAKGELVFLAAFAIYTALAIFLLLLGLVAAAAVDPATNAILRSWATQGGALAPTWKNLANAARFTETPPEIAIDYVLSAVNLAVGAFLVWKRPNDWVARLFGLGMVGVAMGFNFQAHGIVAVAAGPPAAGGVPESFWMQTAHFGFHAISGAAYLTALVVFPNGKFVPRWTKWVAVVLWALVAEELFFSVLALVQGVTGRGVRGLGEGMVPSIFHALFNIQPLEDYAAILSAEVVYFTLLFGLLVPILGVAAQVYRYRRASSAAERAQTHLVVWALAIAFSVGLVVVALDLISFALRGQVFTGESSRVLYVLLLRLTPPLFIVLPLTIAIGVLRYRLFNIEIVVDRTIIYAPLTAAITLVFLGTIFVMQQVLKALIGGPSELAVALAALVNLFLFQPIRRRVQAFVDQGLARRITREPSAETVREAPET